MRECGTRAKYCIDKCRCQLCRKANCDYQRQSERRRARIAWGAEPQIMTDPLPAMLHIEYLRQQGMGYKKIAETAGVATSIIARLIGISPSRPVKKIRTTTAQRILAISDDQIPGGRAFDGTAAVNKLRALVAIGWTQTELAAQLQVTPSYVSVLMKSHMVSAAMDEAIRQLYALLHMKPGNSERARTAARKAGWLAPLAWDDIDQGIAAAIDQTGEPVIDHIAVQQLIEGRKQWNELTMDERMAAAVTMYQRGIPKKQIIETTHLNTGRMEQALGDLEQAA